MKILNKIWDFFRGLLGFNKNSKYVKTYINDANIKSSIYMASIVILLEMWLIIRQTKEYVIPKCRALTEFGDKFDLAYSFLNMYILFIISSITMILFAINYLYQKRNKSIYISNLVFGFISILWFFMVFPLKIKINYSQDTVVVINQIMPYFIYSVMPILGGITIFEAIYKEKYGKTSYYASVGAIICFATICLLFGFYVGFSDFISKRPKMIICFLTMIIFVACLLIWKPYISIIMLTIIFILFLRMLRGYKLREFIEGDEINYITFLVSITMIAISIYQQRLAEALKSQRLEHDAIYDPLIEVHNENYLINQVKENYMNEKMKNYIYLYVNLENFRAINDQKGFDVGDEFLQVFSSNIERIFNDDIVSRQSGDHFIIFSKNENIEDKINQLSNCVQEQAKGLYVHLKVGGYISQQNENPRKAIDKARYACGMIKRKFGVSFLIYNNEINEIFKKRQYIVNHIDEAISNGWIVAYYQPVVWCYNENLCGAEALARWIDPVYGFLSPGDFIPVLEESRLIHKLDRHIIEYVCKNMRKAIDQGRKIVPVSINFSRLDFEFMDVRNVLNEYVNKYNIDKNYLHIEITESALSEKIDEMKETLDVLSNDGYAIWLDDFGSGYSSLNTLKDLKFDLIKIDMQFLSNFSKNENSKVVLDCIIKLADSLHMKTLTEGVETKDEVSFLKEIGCGRLQGYLYGKPLKLEDFEKIIEDKEILVSEKIV